MIIDEENIRVQYESTKESPILRDDVLPYPYRYTEKDQIYVLEGVTELTRNEDFSVSYDGSVTILKDIPIGTVLTIYRSTPLDQGSEFPQEAPFSSKKIEDALDKLTMQNQEQREALSRALKLPMTASTGLADLEMPTPEPNRSVKWNAEGTALINTNFDPDTALEQTEKFKTQAEQAAKDAVAAKESITITEETLVNTAKQATDEINTLAEETQEAIANASKHKLNSKEIASLLVSSAPQEDSDLALADGRLITSEDKCYKEFHNNYMVTQRQFTDKITKYFRYDSYNMSRRWYSTVESTPDKFYGLTDIINAPAGTWYLMDREGEMHLKPSVEVKSYYKYELINAVGHDAPQYILWQVFAGDAQIAEPDTSHAEQFYAYADDERRGAHIDFITNIVVLPPDATSEYRRIQFTQVEGDNTYYNYYKAEPVEIHAYMKGTVEDLNLGGNAGDRDDTTVVKPYLYTTHRGSFDKLTNKDFYTTRQWHEDNLSTNNYEKFYTTIETDETLELRYLHDEVTTMGYLRNLEGIFSGFSKSSYLKLPFVFPTVTSFEGVISREPVITFEMEARFKTSTAPLLDGLVHTIIGSTTKNKLLFGIVGDSTTDKNGKIELVMGDGAGFNVIPSGQNMSKEALKLNTWYKAKVVYENNAMSLFLALDTQEYELQGSIPFTAEQLAQYFPDDLTIGAGPNEGTPRYFEGSVDVANTAIRLNGRTLWGENKTVPYLYKDGEVLSIFSEPVEHSYHKELASNIYETQPTGYTSANPVAIDGWHNHTALGNGYYLGTGMNTTCIDLRPDDYIEISGRIRTNRSKASAASFMLCKTAQTPGPFSVTFNTDGKVDVLMGYTSTTAWTTTWDTSLVFELNTEYNIYFFADFSKKYKEETVDEQKIYTESEDGTLYKYTLRLRPWTNPDDNAEELTEDWYSTHRFGSSTTDVYQISGITYRSAYTKGSSLLINPWSVVINKQRLFNPNRVIVPRPANSTALPRIAETVAGNDTYVVVANGVEEEVVLADPKTVVDKYVANTVTPSLSTLGADLQKTLQNSYNQYSKTLTSTYNQGIKALQNASDAVRKSDLQEVYCVVETFVDGYSWYRRWSDGWLEQGGFASAAGVINLLLPYRDTYFTCTTTPIAAADPYISARTIDTITLAGGAAFWKTEGYEL